MFYLENVYKSETLLIKIGEKANDYAQVKIVMHSDEPVFTITIDAPHFTADDFTYWNFYSDGYTMYFDIRNLITNLISESAGLSDFIYTLNEYFVDGYYGNLIESSFSSYEELHDNNCKECDENNTCEEYLKHKN